MRRNEFEERGYVIVPALLSPDEVAELREEFMALHARGPIPRHFTPTPQQPGRPYDVLRDYPRVMHPHQVNDVALRYLLDARIATILRELLQEEPIAAQSMFYFKPPGAKGQALHQDNFYLQVQPGTCVAAWIALDKVDRANGGLEVVPGTHKMDLFCPEDADPSVSFTRDYVPPPPGLEPVPVDMEPGDVLFFNGSLVHGSEPNTTADRFRCSFICHYAGRSAERIATYYPTITMDGEPIHLEPATGGGPCGTEIDGPH
ncbi:phytanoyl-CoA dioxygenase family protein [Streptosporangium sp. NPDC000396]|uniref:phytanoyl-CoA dioxygenase family protein n=1 Tax=Streptosporangium sp. NPDC000396 TaxID=3366185 RepID=UPI00368EE9EF